MAGDQCCLPSLVAECMASRSDVHSLEMTYGVTNVGFADNLGFQFQLDNNSSGAAVYEWIDQVTFTVW
jgi:hypothetical protein